MDGKQQIDMRTDEMKFVGIVATSIYFKGKLISLSPRRCSKIGIPPDTDVRINHTAGVAPLQNIEIETGRRVERIKQLLGAEVRRISRRKILQEFQAKVGRRHGRVRGSGRRWRLSVLLRWR